MIDMSAMKGIRVDPARRTVRAQTGLKLGEFDRETQAFGLATTQGVVPTVGIAGLTLGGGWGNLHGKFGLAIDNVIGADVVTADGRLLTANASENEDLFWRTRGGSGNFGAVTSIEYRLHEVGPVYGGAIFFPAAKAKENAAALAGILRTKSRRGRQPSHGRHFGRRSCLWPGGLLLWSRRRRRKAVAASQEVRQAIRGYARPHDLYSNPKHVRAVLPAGTARLHQIKFSP